MYVHPHLVLLLIRALVKKFEHLLTVYTSPSKFNEGPKGLRQRIIVIVYKTLGTSVIYSLTDTSRPTSYCFFILFL